MRPLHAFPPRHGPNQLEELVFVSRTDIGRHLTLVAPIEKLLLMTDIHQRTTVDPEYIEVFT